MRQTGCPQVGSAQSPAAKPPVMPPALFLCSVTLGGATLLGKTQASRILVCGSHPTGSKTNLLDGKTDEATSQCPQPCVPQEPVGGEGSSVELCLSRASAPDLNATNGEQSKYSCPCRALPGWTEAPRPPRASRQWHQEASGSHARLQPGPFVPHCLSAGEVDVSFSFHRTRSSLIQI